MVLTVVELAGKSSTLRRSWYLATMVHYQGDHLYAVGFLTREVRDGTIKVNTRWEWIENLPWNEVEALIGREQKGMVRTTPAELRKVLQAGA